jgi:hypothetical protein
MFLYICSFLLCKIIFIDDYDEIYNGSKYDTYKIFDFFLFISFDGIKI